MIKGLWTAIVTPFREGELDEKGLRENLRFQRECEVDGIAALGTTGESPTLSPQECERVVDICREVYLPLMVGTGTNCTRTTIEKTRWAKEFGADFALIITPYYNKPTQEGIYRHFMAVADAVDIPIVVYNHKGRTGVNIETKTLKRMAQNANIVAVKEASGSLEQAMDVIREISHLRVMSGDDKLTYPIMSLGGHGVISVSSNLVPELMRRLVYSENARAIHFELMPLFEATCLETNPIPLKAMMHLAGMAAGECRLPLCEPQPETMKRLQWLIETLTSRL